MTEPAREPPELLLQGVALFNRREFFACHDVLEELWTDTLGREREFFQGLIHAAVALFHFGEGNLGGARKMYGSACNYLSPYRPRFLGVDVDRFLADFFVCFAHLAEATAYPAGVQLDESLIPNIEFGGPAD